MKLVERVLENISSEEISDIASEFGFSAQKMSSVIHAVIPGILSAFKARIVSAMNSGDMSSLLHMLNTTEADLNINNLFDNNAQAMNTLYQRISEFSDVSLTQISEIIPCIMPTISTAISTMFQEYGSHTFMESDGHFINQLITNDNGYEQAINAANSFLGSVFGTTIEQTQVTTQATTQATTEALSNQAMTETDGFVQNLFDLFDQDNDGSVMDDIYRMLVR